MSNGIDPMHNRIVDKTGHKVADSNRKVAESGREADVQLSGSSRSDNGPGKTAAADTVVLTERGQLLERLEKTAAKLPAIDQARVDAVKADIADGKYRVDVDNIADILLRTEADFADDS